MRIFEPVVGFLAATAAVAALVTVAAGPAGAQTRYPSPTGTVYGVEHDLSRGEITALRKGAIHPAAYPIMISVNGHPRQFGAELTFGEYVGFWLVERGQPAQVEYNQYVRLGPPISRWNGMPVYRYRGTGELQGWTYFVYDHHQGVNALLVLQGRSAFLTYCTLWRLFDQANMGQAP